jgi:NhaP-type Na+/H+ or K+/H+ antiporter
MITSLALVFLLGLSLAEIFRKIKLPRIIGLLLTGIILGPYVLDWLDPSLLSISPELRQIALIIILLKAGLSLDLTDLKAVGRPAVMMAFVPASFEIFAYVLIAPALLGVNRLEGAILGSVLAAVSPAVVVPKMLQLMEDGYGTNKKIPQLILAGASADDIFVIVLFSTFIGIAQGNSASILDLLNIPISIGSGILLGVIAGFCLYFFFETAYAKENYVRNSMKVVIILGVAFLLMAIEDWAKSRLAISGLLAIISMAAVLKAKSIPFVSERLSEQLRCQAPKLQPSNPEKLKSTIRRTGLKSRLNLTSWKKKKIFL